MTKEKRIDFFYSINSHLFLFVFILSVFCCHKDLNAAEIKMTGPSRLTQIIWLNNDELLLALGGYYPSRTMLLKFIVSEKKFIPIYNKNFEKNESVAFSKDGKTMLYYDNSSRIVRIVKNKKVIYEEKIPLWKIYGGAGKTDKDSDVNYFLDKMIIENDIAFFKFNVMIFHHGCGTQTQSYFFINRPKTGDKKYNSVNFFKSHARIVNNIREKNLFFYIYTPGNKNDTIAVYEYSFSKDKFTEIVPELPEKYWGGDKGDIKKFDNSVYLALNYYKNIGKQPIPILLVFDLLTGRIKEKYEDIDFFDISGKYLATSKFIPIYSPGNEKKSIGNRIIVTVYNSKKKKIIEKEFTNLGVNIFALYPLISPDNSKIIFLKITWLSWTGEISLSDLKPIIIEM